MTLPRFRSTNHPQQVARRGAIERTDSRATHHSVFAPLNERFSFTLDVAASPYNAKCARFITREKNGLAASWAGERVWCNPPYSALADWVRKAWSEWCGSAPPVCVVMLLPANRTEQPWWQDLVEPWRDQVGSPLRTEFLRGRIRFVRDGAGAILPNERPPFGSVLLVWERRTPIVTPQLRLETTGEVR